MTTSTSPFQRTHPTTHLLILFPLAKTPSLAFISENDAVQDAGLLTNEILHIDSIGPTIGHFHVFENFVPTFTAFMAEKLPYVTVFPFTSVIDTTLMSFTLASFQINLNLAPLSKKVFERRSAHAYSDAPRKQEV